MKGREPHPCIVYLVWFTVSLCHGSLRAWRLTALSLLRPDVAPAFSWSSRPALPCPPASCPWFSSCSWCCPCLSCQTCILSCSPVACCTCFCRRHIPALASALCLTPVGVLIPVCSPSRTLFPFAGQAGHRPLCVLEVAWRRHVPPSPAMLETWRVEPSL